MNTMGKKKIPYLTSNNLTVIQNYLLDEIENESFSAFLANNYKELIDSEIATITNFLKSLTSLSNESNWQVLTRSFGLELYKRLINFITRVIKINGYDEKVSILTEISVLASGIILSDIPQEITDEARQKLIKIIITITNFIMLNDPAFPSIIQRLKQLGIPNAEIDKILQSKFDELKSEEKKGPRNSLKS